MTLTWNDLPETIRHKLRDGIAIPAHPLALTPGRDLDPMRQRALSRYYLDAGAGGLAVGVHTTQFEIRDAGLYAPVLRLAAEEAAARHDDPPVMVAGLVGRTEQACAEADIALGLGYQAGLLSVAAWRGASMDEILDHVRQVAAKIPVIGFYLQPSVGGFILPSEFWRRFAAIENVVAIKVACFDRYGTMDVLRGVVEAGAEDRVTLYTGNDDHIIGDLLTPFSVLRDGAPVPVRFHGGLLGHWSVWTHNAVGIFERCKAARKAGILPPELMALDGQVTDCNSAFFDVANRFAGCIAGCHEVLRRQGLLEGIWCLSETETLGPGQMAEIDRVYQTYPDLNDDAFVAANLDRWLRT